MKKFLLIILPSGNLNIELSVASALCPSGVGTKREIIAASTGQL